MLQAAVIGPNGVENVYFQAFLKGFSMPCVSREVDLYDVSDFSLSL